MPEIQTDANFTYSYLYERTSDTDTLSYAVLGLESQVESDDIDNSYSVVSRVLDLGLEAFWVAGKSYSSTNKLIEYTPKTSNSNLIMGTYSYIVEPTSPLVPIMTSASQGGFIVTASHQYTGHYFAWKLFGRTWGNDSTVWSGGPIGPNAGPWINIQMPVAKKLGKYAIRAYTGFPSQQPKTWKIEGSNDGSSWTLIHQVTDAPGWANSERRVYEANGTVAYIHYRITIIQNHGDNWHSFDEWELFENPDPTVEQLMFWVSPALDLTLYSISLVESLVARAYLPGNSSLKLYVGTGNTKAEAESASLTYVANDDALRGLNINGNKWIVLAIEYVGGA